MHKGLALHILTQHFQAIVAIGLGIVCGLVDLIKRSHVRLEKQIILVLDVVVDYRFGELQSFGDVVQ